MDEDLTACIAHHSTEAILAHPRFAEARAVYVDAILRLYGTESAFNRLMIEAGRSLIFCVVVCLHAGYEPADRATWPTVGRLKDALAQFEAVSRRQIHELIARLVSTGYLQLRAPGGDRRVRIVAPTDKMLAYDREWLAAFYAPLDFMFPNPGYALPMARDRRFQQAQRLASITAFSLAAQIIAGNEAMALFHTRNAGTLILMELIQKMGSNPDGMVAGVTYTDIGLRFDVSRTHVRTLLQEAEQLGLVHLSDEAQQRVRLAPALLEAFDRFVADTMFGNDLLHGMAMEQLESVRLSA